MKNEMKSILPNIKNSLEVDKDLKIDELEKENAFLTIQVNKYKKIVNEKEKKDLIPNRKTKNKEYVDKAVKKYEVLKKAIKIQVFPVEKLSYRKIIKILHV